MRALAAEWAACLLQDIVNIAGDDFREATAGQKAELTAIRDALLQKKPSPSLHQGGPAPDRLPILDCLRDLEDLPKHLDGIEYWQQVVAARKLRVSGKMS